MQNFETFQAPHLVRYITSCSDPKSNLPLLVMELMDESLTHFLKRYSGKCPDLLPRCTQISLSLNIASALSYIHAKNFLHIGCVSDSSAVSKVANSSTDTVWASVGKSIKFFGAVNQHNTS